MNNTIGFHFCNQGIHSGPIPDVQFMMLEPGQCIDKAFLIPPRITTGAEKHSPLVIVNSMDSISELREIHTDFGADQA
ncbi:MAG: hypothetical protein BWY82_02348 [Verrucomicrobia bacterium ADurb.Bin474]|nr:MAG: hypothetical protein BWY82_02348 [Verrucomicrobia bacterium ADurb.Bin474]